ncbi:MAG: DMT family transporter [Myxococcota bacterium]
MTVQVLLVALLAQTCGGLAPILTKLALGGLGPWTMVASRQAFGVLALLALDRLTHTESRKREPFSRHDWGLLILLSWAGFALPQVLLANGIELSTGTSGALLSPLEPIGILAGGWLFLRERLTPLRIASVAIGTAGALLIVMQGAVRPELGDPLGDGLIALGHLSWAIYTLAAKPLLERHDAMRVSLAAVLLSIPPLFLLALGEEFSLARALPALGWVIALAFLGTALGSWSWNWALRRMSSGTMAAFIFVQPVVGLAAGHLALGEPVGALALAGAAVILLGVTLEAVRGGA